MYIYSITVQLNLDPSVMKPCQAQKFSMDGWRDVNIVHNLEMLERIGLAFSMLWDLNLSNKATKDFFK